jgi:hypothetical protein
MYDVVSLKSDITMTPILPGDWLTKGGRGRQCEAVSEVVGEVSEVGKVRWVR